MTSEKPGLIAFSGLPGVGKSTLASRLAQAMQAVYLRIDSIEQALACCSLEISPAEDAGYEAAYLVAKDNLLLGHYVIADAVNPIALTRKAWANIAKACGAKLVQVEIICSDLVQQKHRVEARLAPEQLRWLPTWEQVQHRHYEAWQEERLVIDTANKSIPEAFDKLFHDIQPYLHGPQE